MCPKNGLQNHIHPVDGAVSNGTNGGFSAGIRNSANFIGLPSGLYATKE